MFYSQAQIWNITGRFIMDFSFKYLLIAFIFFPICTMVHELGHAFFIKLWGWKVKKIQIGWGDTLISIGRLSINKIFFISGATSYERPDKVSKTKWAIVLLGGVIFNGFFIGVLYLVSLFFKTEYIGIMNFLSCLYILWCLIPYTDLQGRSSDGKQLLSLLRSTKTS